MERSFVYNKVFIITLCHLSMESFKDNRLQDAYNSHSSIITYSTDCSEDLSCL